jgi:uncharacterized protein YgiB involved in biofilm formation
MKRSASVSLVLMASVSAMAALSACGEAPADSKPDNGGTFANKAECVAVYDQETCDAADKLARQEHVQNAPKFNDRASCVAQFGADMCRPASEYGGASNIFVPAMMGYLLGSAMSTPAPLYYGPGSYRERERRGAGYAAPIYSSGRGYSSRAPIGTAPYSSKSSISTKGNLKSSTAMTPPASMRGGFGSSFKPSTSFKSSYAAKNPSSFGRSTFSSGSSYSSGRSYSSAKSYSGSSSFSSRGGFGGSGRSFGGGFGG